MYVKATNGTIDQFPYTISDLRRDNPNTSFPKRISEETLAAWGVYPVQHADMPSHTERTQKVETNDQPTLSGETWTLGYTVTDKTSDEVQHFDDSAAYFGRRRRDELIAETDWWASSDLTMTSEQTAYRQALRDITAHANWPHLNDDDWPTKP
jgi:hypothetical protein